MTNNTERLQGAGVIKKIPLPEDYQSVVDGLSEEEVEALIGVTERLRDMDVQAHGPEDSLPPDEFFVGL